MPVTISIQALQSARVFCLLFHLSTLKRTSLRGTSSLFNGLHFDNPSQFHPCPAPRHSARPCRLSAQAPATNGSAEILLKKNPTNFNNDQVYLTSHVLTGGATD